MPTPRVSVYDVLTADVQAEIRALAGSDFQLRFARTAERTEQFDLVSDCDFLLIGPEPVPKDVIDRCTRVRLIQKWGVGMDKVDLQAARDQGIGVAIAAGSNAAPVSELALALMLAVNRRLTFADSGTRRGAWPRPVLRSTCLQMDGQTVGLLGFGAIARATARRLTGFDTRVLYHSNRRADPGTEQALKAEHVTLDELLSQSDILSIHVPLTEATRHMIDAAALARMKPGAILVNTARGPVVDEAALVDALVSGRLRGAGLDVFETEPPPPDHPLLKLDNVVVMPHAGGGVFNNVRRVMGHSLDNMRKVLAGQPLAPADIIVPLPAQR
jgi:phosphoglycerate dehydrogenase-like enzyme